MAPLIVIVGETASGKSALAIELAKKFSGEIICADSRTVYKNMDIGTAKPSRDEQKEVPHHLLDVVEPDQYFSVADFKQQATVAIEDISNRGKVPIMVGGSGLYIDSVLFDFQFSQPGADRDEQNPRHLKKTGPVTEHKLRANTLVLGLQIDRLKLEKRIRERIDQMVQNGFINELQQLAGQYGWDNQAMLAPGYKAFREYIDGAISLQEAKERFARADMHLAKRQRTWFKRNKSIQWLDDSSQAVKIATQFLKNTISS